MAEIGLTEGCCQGNIGGNATDGHEDATDAWHVVACVKGPPAVFEIDLEPCAEIHGAAGWHADISEIASGVACRDIHGAAEGDGQMLEITADADALGEDIERCLGWARRYIVKAYFLVDPVTDSLHASPARGRLAEEFVGNVAEAVDFTI